ncbi:MAG: hypothetical protein M3R08_03895 [Bacteroidota bacterium]|nr:hypothetical protein [Bacteroidota bacterium]
MPELNDNELRKLFRTAGRQELGTDLTDRIMARVAVTPVLAPLEVKPLIGKAGWFFIAACFIGLLVLLFNVASAGPSGPSILDPLWQKVPGFEGFSIKIPTGQWTIWAAGAAGCMLLFTLVDRALEGRKA